MPVNDTIRRHDATIRNRFRGGRWVGALTIGRGSRRGILSECRGGTLGRVRYFLSLPIRAVFSISFMFFGSPEG
jgi:hypothetical protein